MSDALLVAAFIAIALGCTFMHKRTKKRELEVPMGKERVGL